MDAKYAVVVLAGVLSSCTMQFVFGASFVPVNDKVFSFQQDDGSVRMFVRDEEEPNRLFGDGDWVAELDGRRSLIMNETSSPSARRGFMFVDGHLRKQLIGSKESDVAIVPPGNDPSAIPSLWPKSGERLIAAQAPDIWKDGERLRLWFDNPNKAGLLFSEIALAALALLFLRSLWLRILGGILSLLAFVGLVQTSSRGALLSLLCGVAIMALTRFKSLFSWKRMILIVAVSALAVGSLFIAGQFDRMGKNLLNEGQRETSRLTVWKTVPSMIVDAPNGWGYGNSARAYIDWYQPKSECLLKDLISGHLTFLVESGWCVRFAYVFFWLSALFMAISSALHGKSPVPAAILVAFAIAGCFNPVIAVPELWAIPFGSIVFVVMGLMHGVNVRRVLVPIILAAVSATVMLAAPFVLKTRFPAELPVAKEGKAVLLNGKNPDVWMVDDDYVLHGGYWWMEGRSIRDYYVAHPDSPALGYVRNVADLPKEADKIVLVGESGKEFLSMKTRPVAKKIVFLSPPFSWTEVPADLQESCDVSFIMGEHVARLVGANQKPPSWVRVFLGAKLYIPTWIEFVL